VFWRIAYSFTSPRRYSKNRCYENNWGKKMSDFFLSKSCWKWDVYSMNSMKIVSDPSRIYWGILKRINGPELSAPGHEAGAQSATCFIFNKESEHVFNRSTENWMNVISVSPIFAKGLRDCLCMAKREHSTGYETICGLILDLHCANSILFRLICYSVRNTT
jgi:hypothetical protein